MEEQTTEQLKLVSSKWLTRSPIHILWAQTTRDLSRYLSYRQLGTAQGNLSVFLSKISTDIHID